MSVDRVAVVYSGSDLDGRAHGMSLDDSNRFHAVDCETMLDLDLSREISSVKLNEADETSPLSLILFDDYNDYYGAFLQATSVGAADYSVTDLRHLNNSARSMLLVRRDLKEQRFSMRTLLALMSADPLLDDAVQRAAEDEPSVRRITRNGDLALYWVTFPKSIPGLSSNSQYVALWQRLNVEVATMFFGDYDVSVNIYLKFYVYRNTLFGRVEGWSIWVAPGTVRAIVEVATDAAIGRFANDLNKTLGELGDQKLFDREYSSAFLLPGNQAGRETSWENWGHPTDSGTYHSWGNTDEDVTLALVKIED